VPSIQRFGERVESEYGGLKEQVGELPTIEPPEHLLSPIKRQFMQKRAIMMSQLKLARPTASLEDSDVRQVMDEIDQQERESVTNLQFRYMGELRQNIQLQYGISDDLMTQLGELAKLDIQTIMLRTGLQAEEANQFRQTFGALGAGIAQAGVLGRFLGP
jgi:hypothetical protein